APSIITIKINPDKIREVIGPGGKIINKIIEETGAEIDIEDDGTIFVTAVDQSSGKAAQKWINDITREVQAGEVFEGKIVRILDFGAFIELLPGQDGLLHISQVAKERVTDINKHLKLNEIVKVKVKEIDKQGRISLIRAEK
ncbi:MAG: S1 RNA-binding domain-containing protein, partial [Candidatus Moranbacteria bacterium]|nr:S1 RNA-binding domain-containing protein [Candidatus Moranbacteria bacterium]